MLYTFLTERMQQYPQHVLQEQDTTLTYRELITEAQQCAKALTQQKYGILCKSELNTVKALLGCFCARKTAVLMSHRYGEIHNQKIIKQMKVSFVITDEGIQQISQPEEETENLSDVAVILSTSGTTGMPKGAMITQNNLLSNLQAVEQYFQIDSADRILITRPLYHCAVLTGELLTSLCRGLNISFQPGAFRPQTVLRRIYEDNITVLCGTPTLFHHLYQSASHRELCLPLKTIAVSGECMSLTAAQEIRQLVPQANVYHVYGLTEASPRVSALPPEQFAAHPLSVGFPLSGIEANVCDGELLIKGASVMKGYYAAQDATRRVLKDGWLHTGDMADMDCEGRITILSRKDDMIIRAGMNVYPAEIENALKTDKRIKDVMVYGVSDAATQKIFCKMVANGLTKPELLTLCRSVLSPHQIPDQVEFVDSLPRNASGKVVRRMANERKGI